jgi:sulfite exporter TauE/SafE
VIGLILLGVAATLSQTMGFSPVLLLFLGVALPTLVLYYRLRLALRALRREGLDKKNLTSPNFKVLIVNFLLISGLCPEIFSVFRRFYGYKLRYFPVECAD